MTNPAAPHDVTELLGDVQKGDREALAKIFVILYSRLKDLARAKLNGETQETIDSAGLVDLVVVKLDQTGKKIDLKDSRHFVGVAGKIMHRLLIDRARIRNADKRRHERAPFDENVLNIAVPTAERELILAVGETLEQLSEVDPEAHRIVELRYLRGFTENETAQSLGISGATIRRRWPAIQKWLQSKLKDVVDLD